MYAKLHYNSSPDNLGILADIIKVITGTIDKYELNGVGIDHTKTYVNTSKNVAGWRLDYYNDTPTSPIYIVSAPCANSAKRKYVKFYMSSTNIVYVVGYGFTGSDITVASDAKVWIYSAPTHSYSSPNFEVRLSASARHLLLTAGTTGYATGYGTQYQGSGAYAMVSGCFEHTCADSYFVEDTEYVPAMSFSTRSGTVGGSSPVGVCPKYRNIKTANITDITGASATAIIFTRSASGNFDDVTQQGTGRIWTSESSTVKALFPFGVNNSTYCFRGGSISDLCGIYLGAPGSFSDFVDIKAGASDSVYSMWNVGCGGYYLAVPKG